MLDPDIPKLHSMLKNLRAGVEEGSFTPDVASEILGNYADSLIEKRLGPDWRQRVIDAYNRAAKRSIGGRF